MKNKIKILLIVLVVILIVIDQASKIIVTNNLKAPIGDSYMGLEVVSNTGMALGFAEGNKRNIVMTIFVLLIIGTFIKNQIERIDTRTAIAISLALAGGISNLIDRIFRNGVCDFIRIYTVTINLADIFVVVGWFLLIVALYEYTRKN